MVSFPRCPPRARCSGCELPAVMPVETEVEESSKVDRSGAHGECLPVACDTAVADSAVPVGDEPGNRSFDHRSVLAVVVDAFTSTPTRPGRGDSPVSSATRARGLVGSHPGASSRIGSLRSGSRPTVTPPGSRASARTAGSSRPTSRTTHRSRRGGGRTRTSSSSGTTWWLSCLSATGSDPAPRQ